MMLTLIHSMFIDASKSKIFYVKQFYDVLYEQPCYRFLAISSCTLFYDKFADNCRPKISREKPLTIKR
jgi:hypothetical protein